MKLDLINIKRGLKKCDFLDLQHNLLSTSHFSQKWTDLGVALCAHTDTKSLGMLPAEEIKAGQEATHDVFIAPQANKALVTFAVLRI